MDGWMRHCGALLTAGLLLGCPADDRVETDVCHAIADGTSCDDGNPCTVNDKCGQGLCLGAPVKDRTTCDDQDPCTVDDECMAGVCVGLNVCRTPSEDVAPATGCDGQAAGAACDDGDLCTTGDACDGTGQCVGTAVSCAASAGGCVVGTCDAATGACVDGPAQDGTGCDDGDPCTTGEKCSTGVCGGATLADDGTPCDDGKADTLSDACKSGLCVGQPKPCDGVCCDGEEGIVCDDGNGCTEGDVCADKRCVGAPRVMDCTQLDAACVVGACVPATGTCGPVQRPDGIPCDDGLLCTLDDACQTGSCRGVRRDCTGLDEPCVVGVCDAATGDCQAVNRSDGYPCHDGDPCTGHDDCNAGVCRGEVDLCEACDGLATGAACDDGDPCTPGQGVCVQVASGLRCEAELTGCSEASEACAVGTCDSSVGDGTCVPIMQHDGAQCDDGNPCTVQDSCVTGVCTGTLREMCGATPPDFCETGASNDSIGSAIPLAVGAGVTVLGSFESSGDIDWYAINVEHGQLVDVVTRAHCNSEIRTVITAVRPGGKTTVAAGAQGAVAGWAKLIGDRAGAAGTYYIGVAALGITTGKTYFVDISLKDAQPCATDGECHCEQLMCATGGAAVGTCIPNIPVEVEPNDGAADAMPLALGARALGRLGSPSDQDWYRLELTAGQPISVTTRATCDEAVEPEAGAVAQTIDTEIRLYAADGTSELALATGDPGGGAAARLIDYLVPQSGTYFVRVGGESGALGAYVVTANVTGCSAAEPCTCIDQTCNAATAGVCKPKLTAPEPGPNDAAAVALVLGKRLHSEIGVPYDKDYFELTLGEGTYDIVTASFCGSSLDTRLEVFDQSAEPVLLASDDDSGQNLFAQVTGFAVVGAQPLRIVVSAGGAAVGSYLIIVKPSTSSGAAAP